MGITTLTVHVANPGRPDMIEAVECIIGSGTLHSVVPTEILERLDIHPFAEWTYRLADGRRIVRERGIAIVRLDNQIGSTDVVFGEAGDAALIGAVTLENLRLGIDPLQRRLIPLPEPTL